MSDPSTNQSPRSNGWQARVFAIFRSAIFALKFVLQPLLAIAFVIALAFLFAYAQRNYGWFNGARTSMAGDKVEEDSLFACSMLCVFVKAPGRCPVCGMELQEIEVPGDPKDIFGVTIDPTSKRLANIQTVAALNMPLDREIEVLGKITYDETTLATIAAYFDGRIEKLHVDFVGARVQVGDPIANLYSPDLYADQVGLLSARKALQENRSNNERVIENHKRLYESARRRLIELGFPSEKIEALERAGKANSNIEISAPLSGTVTKKLIDEGQYVETGMPILAIADLSKVWLMLEMFPEDTTSLKIGQAVTVSIQSQAGRRFEGTISFVDPMVDPSTQTVDVRVVIPNEAGLIKIGDFGRAKIHALRENRDNLVVVPREAVLMNGTDSIVYVETKPGRFEFRTVEVADVSGDKITIASGITPGEQVVASGAFMLDSTFNMQGKVSLIDPRRAARINEADRAKEIEEAQEIEQAFAALSLEDRQLSEKQVICPVSQVKLGTKGMGKPIRVKLSQRDVMVCCEACRRNLESNPAKYFKVLQRYRNESAPNAAMGAADEPLNQLSDVHRALAERQVICPVTESPLGSMGTPIVVDVGGRMIMICCEGCRTRLLDTPDRYLAFLANYHDDDVRAKQSRPENRAGQSDSQSAQQEIEQ